MTSYSTLDAQVRRLRTGDAYAPSFDTDSVAWSRVIVPLMAIAQEDLRNQIERLDRFSLPLVPSGPSAERANATRTAQRFLSQLRSDYRRMAVRDIDLVAVEEQRKWYPNIWTDALAKFDVENCPVAILAVGQYLATDRSANLATALKPWIPLEDDPASFISSFGPVVGPVVKLALSEKPEPALELPSWAEHVGVAWCEEFLNAAAQELRRLDKFPVQAQA